MVITEYMQLLLPRAVCIKSVEMHWLGLPLIVLLNRFKMIQRGEVPNIVSLVSGNKKNRDTGVKYRQALF